MKLNAEQYAELRALFDHIVELPREQRSAFIESHPTLGSHLECLLAEDERSNTPLDRDPAGLAGDLMDGQQPAACGPYGLEEVIGEGGSGIVYRGRRADLNSVAAIKILRDAWISPSRRQRFEREQRTLAALQHPAIARLLDAGVTPDGTPWIAMELVDGVPITRAAGERSLDVVQRLQLFRTVCAAVQYAHERAIIHRDLKPSNILVDALGAPRLLDFGIARNLDEAGADITRADIRLMTPSYAAPEQIRGEPAGVYTDIYTLGVILYELLARRLPEPGGPPSASPTRASGPAAWEELDVVCAKAMHADPAQRYRSAHALSGDLERYLASQPLEARPDSTVYKLSRFLVRHRAAVIAVVLAGLLLSTSAAVFTWQLRRSRDEAVAAVVRAQRIQSFLMNLFEGGDAAAGPARGLTVETLIDRGVRESGSLDREPVVQGEVYETLGRMYGRLGRYPAAEKMLTAAVERNAGRASAISSLTELASIKAEQGEFETALSLVRRAISDSEEALGRKHDLTIGAREMLGRILTERGSYGEAIRILEEALVLREESQQPATVASAASALASAHFYSGHFDESRRLNTRALGARIQAHGERHPLVAEDRINLGAIEFDTGRYSEAEKYYRQALAVKKGWYGADHPDTASAQTMLGRALVYQKKFGEARPLLQQALATQEKVFGAEHTRVASTLNDLGNIFVAEENYTDAELCFQRMEVAYRKSRGDGHYLVATALSNRANVYLRQGHAERAERMFRDVVARYTRALSAEHLNTAIARVRLGRALVRQKRWREAASESRAGYEILLKQAKAPTSWLQGAREDLASAYAALGDQAQADRFRTELAAAR
jgi:serine/threonine-protein kinase